MSAELAMLAVLGFMMLGLAQTGQAENAKPRTITSTADLRSLSPEEADSFLPVDITGIITQTNAEVTDLFLQQGSQGIYVQIGAIPNPIRPGLRARVTGISRAGWFSPIVVEAKVEILGPSVFPDPVPYNFSINDARWLDAQFVQAFCLIRDVTDTDRGLRITVEGTGGIGVVMFREAVRSSDIDCKPGSILRVRGVCTPEFTMEGKVTGTAQVTLQSRRDFTVLETPERVAAAPIRKTQFLRRYLPGVSPIPIVRMQGVVTCQLDDERLLVQDDTGGFTVRLQAGGASAIQPGASVEALGFLTWNGQKVAVHSAKLTQRGAASLPEPADLDSEADLPTFDACRIRMTGRVVETRADRLVILAKGVTASVVFPPHWDRQIETGSMVKVTGALTSRNDLSPGVIVVPIDASEIVVTARPDRPWISAYQLRFAAITLALILGLGATWVTVLRRALDHRTQMLRASELKFSTAFHSSPDVILLTRAADGKIIEANDGLFTLIGRTRDQVLGSKLTDFATSVDGADTPALSDIPNLGATRDIPIKLRDAKGRQREVEITSTHINVGEVDTIFSLIRDVTERNEAERAVRNSEAKFAKLFTASPNALAIVRASDGKILEVNDAYLKLSGFSHRELMESSVLGITVVEDRSASASVKTELELAGRIRNRDATLRTKKGEKRHVLASVELVEIESQPCVLYAVQDVTARIKMERALAASERKFSALFQMSPVALALSTLDGVLLDANQAFVHLLGIPREQLLGKRAIEALRVWLGPRDGSVLDYSARNVEQSIQDANGNTITTVTSTELIELDGTAHVLIAVSDITLQKRAQEILRSANAILERRVAERTAELSLANQELEAFCYSVSHDLRAPLRSIAGFSQAVLEDYADKLEREGADFLNRIREGAKRMGELIDDLLNLSRVSRADMHRELVNLSELAMEIMDENRRLEPHRAIEVQIDQDLHVTADKNLMRVLLQNLLSNAIKYTSRTPHARVKFGRRKEDAADVFYVEDNGAGFDSRYASKLFQPFQRLHRSEEFPGHGVGLATVLRIVRRHGGQVSAKGEIGAGATFSFTISTAD